MPFKTKRALKVSDVMWEHKILPVLYNYGLIPNVSPQFDPDWQKNGHMAAAVSLLVEWAENQPIPGLSVKQVQLPGLTPVILMKIKGTAPGRTLIYGHCDKQPEMTGWRDGLSAWQPLRIGDEFYGRGLADDGYSTFASLAAPHLLIDQDIPYPDIVILIEADEESGSKDLPAYIDFLAGEIGTPDLIICLDSGCGTYDQLWTTNSLRGVVNGNLKVEILKEGVHSGDASGVVPSSFRILRRLLDRMEDSFTGIIRPEQLYVDVPTDRMDEARAVAVALGDAVWRKFPFVDGALPMNDDPLELVLNRTWRPTLSYIGAKDIPCEDANMGNVLRPSSTLRLSTRTPPTLDAEAAGRVMKEIFEADPPYGARVTFVPDQIASGWNAPSLAPWLASSVNHASEAAFGKPAMAWGEGGSIPFMKMLGDRYPDAQFLITGILGPGSNAHGANEFLHVPAVKQLTVCIAHVLADQAAMD
ncbi:MAG: M20/M25/M40 family metallo-hydrolase [bacterium]|nr:M20/M25/M40 family metallo-hydrolase [bacterium]